MNNIATGVFKRLAGCFLAGLLAILPAVLTISVVVWVAGFIHRLVGRGTAIGNGLQSSGFQFVTNSTAAYVIGWIVVLLAVFSPGLLVEMGAKRFLHRLFDAVARRVPLIGDVYGTSKQLVAMFVRKNESEMKAPRLGHRDFVTAQLGERCRIAEIGIDMNSEFGFRN